MLDDKGMKRRDKTTPEWRQYKFHCNLVKRVRKTAMNNYFHKLAADASPANFYKKFQPYFSNKDSGFTIVTKIVSPTGHPVVDQQLISSNFATYFAMIANEIRHLVARHSIGLTLAKLRKYGLQQSAINLDVDSRHIPIGYQLFCCG